MRHAVAFFFLLLLAANLPSQSRPDLHWSAPGAGAQTITTDGFFLSDGHIATRNCLPTPPCTLTVLVVGHDGISVVASAPDPVRFAAPRLPIGPPAADRNAVAPASEQLIDIRNTLLSASTLQPVGTLPHSPNVRSADGSLLGFSDYAGHWCVATPTEPGLCHPRGDGELLGLGQNLLVVSEPSTSNARFGPTRVVLTDRGGKFLAPVPSFDCGVPLGPYQVTVTVKGALVSGCKRYGMVDRSGRVLWTFRKSPEPTDSVRASQSGTRILLAEQRREVWFGRRIAEIAQALPSMGERGPDLEANVLLLTVLQGETGKVCFRKKLTYKDFSSWPIADLSPDGRTLLLAHQGTLTLSAFSDTCPSP